MKQIILIHEKVHPLNVATIPMSGSTGTKIQTASRKKPPIACKAIMNAPTIRIMSRINAPIILENNLSIIARNFTSNDPSTLPADICRYGENNVLMSKSKEK